MLKIEDKPVSGLLDLSGKRAVVTGAAAGIGYAIAKRLAEAGATVLITDINREAIEEAEHRLSSMKCKVKSLVSDAGREADIKSLFSYVADSFGGVDILVNNAGIYPATKILDMSLEQWREVIRINLESAFLCSQEAGRIMVRQGTGGVIVNISSMAALKPCFPGLAHYGASKGGVVNLTRSTALELAPHKIRAVAVVPGGILTGGVRSNLKQSEEKDSLQSIGATIPLGGFGQPDDIARTVLFLASDSAAYITGTTILVDGGAMLV
ncbi:oxidoreductase, short-chain dehydrogenase/reductase family [Geobacter metallireducens GS-15]|uniref:Oxidoreductase, short-chain dehydrogenase/reductase family n=1 Tax=Geobacter metallireducens (strain ATCC 53774 / DSM 7210 / GS-15) TaxID=269799 RepID=Q39TG1_GEOMG|nr:SDR family NAD(P)-dependent oxidoreductase [Geobacter metallireducens]ABB32463.1 oxidoreductase, short-chain dehydrogenase/reductase family [Geobacter metallireducens GS-15]